MRVKNHRPVPTHSLENRHDDGPPTISSDKDFVSPAKAVTSPQTGRSARVLSESSQKSLTVKSGDEPQPPQQPLDVFKIEELPRYCLMPPMVIQEEGSQENAPKPEVNVLIMHTEAPYFFRKYILETAGKLFPDLYGQLSVPVALFTVAQRVQKLEEMLDRQLSEFEGFSKGLAYNITNYPQSCINYEIQYRTVLPADYVSQWDLMKAKEADPKPEAN